VTAISFSPDGAFFATCSSDLTIRIFMTDPPEGFVSITLTGHRGKQLFAVFAAQTRKLTSLGADGSFFVWAVELDFSVTIISKRRLDEENFDEPKNLFQWW
jgi:periodic tryptophan protein 2